MAARGPNRIHPVSIIAKCIEFRIALAKSVLRYALHIVTQIIKDTPSVQNLIQKHELQAGQFDSSRRLLVYQREYLVFDRTFSDSEVLQDWLAINTLLSHQDIDLLCSKGQIMLGEGIHQELFAA